MDARWFRREDFEDPAGPWRRRGEFPLRRGRVREVRLWWVVGVRIRGTGWGVGMVGVGVK